MDVFDKKVIDNYWRQKLMSHPVIGYAPVEDTAAVESLTITPQALAYYNKLTGGNEVAGFTVMLAIFSALVQRYFGEHNLVSYAGTVFQTRQTIFYKVSPLAGYTLKEFITRFSQEVEEVYPYLYDGYNISAIEPLSTFSPFHFALNRTSAVKYATICCSFL